MARPDNVSGIYRQTRVEKPVVFQKVEAFMITE